MDTLDFKNMKKDTERKLLPSTSDESEEQDELFNRLISDSALPSHFKRLYAFQTGPIDREIRTKDGSDTANACCMLPNWQFLPYKNTPSFVPI